MCDFFSWKRMENDQGDLIDIVRATAGRGSAAPTADDLLNIPSWHLPPDTPPFPPPSTHSLTDDFGDPFGDLRYPLLHELPGSTTAFFDAPEPSSSVAAPARAEAAAAAGAQKILSEEMKRPCNIFSRMLQISPAAARTSPMSPRAIKPSPIITSDMMKPSNPCCPVDHVGGMQISSPRTPGLKRRKSQAKKVVCIPAPTAASSRPSGEVVPSDLWAWRKYGQKPIKGSPYPRGYYRCSSSKGCSARKQVERSRTDPNMLVITYTSEHNHPWPTQRNALAGSTRAQPSKNSSSSSAPKSSPHNQILPAPTGLKAEPKEAMSSTLSTPTVKEEVGEMEGVANLAEFDQPFHQSYKPMIPDSNQPDDFFADLAELEPDPMSLIFSTGFMGEKSDDQERESKAMDPFNMFDWAENSMEVEAKKGL